MNNPVFDVIPEVYLKRYAEAVKDGRFGVIIVVSDEAMALLKQDKTALLDEGGKVVILIPRQAIEEAYREKT